MERVGRVSYVFELDQTLEVCGSKQMGFRYLDETHRPVVLLTETQFAETWVATKQFAQFILQIIWGVPHGRRGTGKVANV